MLTSKRSIDVTTTPKPNEATSHTFRVPYTTSKYGTRYMNIEAEYHQEAMDLVESMVPDCTSVHHPTIIETHNSDDQVMVTSLVMVENLFSLIGWTFVTTWETSQNGCTKFGKVVNWLSKVSNGHSQILVDIVTHL